MNSAQQCKTYDGIYALKAICAFFVVIYHVPFWKNSQLIPISNIAVPVFYMISGFFLFTGDAKNEISKAKKWIKKVIIWTVALNILYFIFVRQFKTEISLFDIICILFQGGVVSPPLWYMTALWEALLVFIIARQILPKKLLSLLITISPLAFLLSLATWRYNCCIFNNSINSRWFSYSFITVAIPCISLGYIIGAHKKGLSHFHRWGILTLLCIILAYVEHYTLEGKLSSGYYLSTLPLSFCMLMFAINSKAHLCRILVAIGQRDSAYIYYFHMLVVHFITYGVWKSFAPDTAQLYGLVIFLLCIIFSETYHFFYSLSYRFYCTIKK